MCPGQHSYRRCGLDLKPLVRLQRRCSQSLMARGSYIWKVTWSRGITCDVSASRATAPAAGCKGGRLCSPGLRVSGRSQESSTQMNAVCAGSPVTPCLPPRYLEKAGGHGVSVEHGTIQGHPLADQPQDLLPLVANVGAVLLLAASRGLRVEGGHQSREHNIQPDCPPHRKQEGQGCPGPTDTPALA